MTDDDDADIEAIVLESLRRLHPFPVTWEQAEATFADDTRADLAGLAREHLALQYLGNPYEDDPDPLGVLAPVLWRLAHSNGEPNQVWCGAGWHRLVAETDRRLAEIDPWYSLGQVKEKYGLLRYYARPSSVTDLDEECHRQFRAIISSAEVASGFLCEVCGHADAQLLGVGRGRTRTLCDSHTRWGVQP
ncbi:hypothetical protein [Blastococcus sp. CCUG 61487]|uniref:hypothetical protein n=1 Tax=Blastococcus sp. CCUG 61487 TaxID=1840703 RepID=UPI0010BFFBA3|nr:hypothetical protein [Blastococcus sp. CCUG 61487]TKJ31913.1 hypothetical protein A6V29_17875 [Blastococcus sp. CCUG 61487]